MKYQHIIYVKHENDKSTLCIDRLFENGIRSFMTGFEIKPSTNSEDELWDEFEKLGALVGKSICIDCPDVRSIMGIDE